MSDEELQKNIEQGESLDGPDAHAYARVFDALRREPSFRLRTDFTERVMSRIGFSAQRASHDVFWLYLGLSSCLVALLIAVAMTNFRLNFGAFRFIADYSGFLIFAVLFILALQWVDKKVVRRHAA